MIEIKRHAKCPGISIPFSKNPLGICILSRKESTETAIVTGTARAVQVGAHLVSAGSIPAAKWAWGSYRPPCPYKRSKRDSEFPRLQQTIIIYSVKCSRPIFSFLKRVSWHEERQQKVLPEPQSKEGAGENAKGLQVLRQDWLNAWNSPSRKLSLNFKPVRTFACSRLK